MKAVVRKRIGKIIDNHLPLIQTTITQKVLPMVKGSLQNKKNQIFVFQLLYRSFNSIPVLSFVTGFIKEDDFVEFCLPQADKLLAPKESIDVENDETESVQEIDSEITEESSIDDEDKEIESIQEIDSEITEESANDEAEKIEE